MEKFESISENNLERVQGIVDQIREILSVEIVSPDDGDRITALVDQGEEMVNGIEDPEAKEKAGNMLHGVMTEVRTKLESLGQ